MRSVYLPVFYTNAIEDVVEKTPEIVSGAKDIYEVIDFCQLFRVWGISSLLLNGTSQELMECLQRSGQAFLHFLSNRSDEEKVTSLAAPFFVAFACKDFNTAKEIALNSRKEFKQGEEYEEDFYYISFLMNKFYLGSSDEECQKIVDDFEEILAGDEDPHLEICKSVLDNDPAMFYTALTDLIENHADNYVSKFNKGNLSEEDASTEGNYFVEGQALINLAKIHGIGAVTNEIFELIPTNMEPDPILDYSKLVWDKL